MIYLGYLLLNHRGALEAELINRGLRLRDLGTEELSIRDLFVIVTNLGQEPTPLNVALNGQEIYTLTYQMQLLHSMEYQLRIANYAQTKDAEKKRNTPYPIELPGYGPYGDKDKKIQEVDSVPHEEIHDLFFANYDESQFTNK